MKLNDRWGLPVYPVFKDENSNESDKKIGEAKNRKKRQTG